MPVAEVRDAMIVAGGQGTRLWPLTAATPKPLLPFCGAPFLAGVVRRLAAAGIDRVLLVVGADPRPFEVLRDDAAKVGVELACVPEPTPLDTAGGVRAAVTQVRGTFLVLNGDILTDLDLAPMLRAHRAAGAAATLALTRVEDTSAFGVCLLEGTRIVGFVEKPPPGTLPGQDAVNAGTYVLEPDVLDRFPPGPLSFERTVFPTLVAGDVHVEGHVSDACWADLGTPQRYLDGHRLALRGALRWPSLEDVPGDGDGVRVAPGARVAADARLVGPVLVGPGAHVDADVELGPDVVLGAGAAVWQGARVRASVLGTGAQVGAHAAVEGLVAGVGARVAVGGRVRGPAVLGDGAEPPAGHALGAGETFPVRA